MTEIINTFVFPIVRTDHILRALHTLYDRTPENFHVIVVDQTKPDPEFEAKLRPLCDLWIKTHKNYGFSQATNLGMRLAPTPYVTTCNDDVEFINDDWWPGIEEAFERFPRAWCVNPMSPKEPGWGYGEPGFRYLCTYEESKDPAVIEALVRGRNGQVIDGIVCWCATFKAEMFDEIGMFDERFWPAGGEDYDLMGRIYRQNKRALATSRSWVWHHWGPSKDAPGGLDMAQPPARTYWNRLGDLWPDGFDVWGREPGGGDLLFRVEEVARLGL